MIGVLATLMLFYHIDYINGLPGFLFQKDNIPTVNAFAYKELNFNNGEPIRELSVCSWTYPLYFRESTYVFSYATSDKDNNEMNYGLRLNRVLMAIGAKYVNSDRDHSFKPKTWIHSCFVINETAQMYSVYVNGKLDIEGKFTPRNILMNGSFILGQECDSVAGGFQEQQSFSGYFTELHIFSYPIPAWEVEKLYGCSSSVAGDILSWDVNEWQLNGTVEITDIPVAELCGIKRKELIVIPENMNFNEARHLCKKFKADIPVPTTPEENTFYYSKYAEFATKCKPQNHASSFMWIGATDAGVEGTWTDLNSWPLNFTNFAGSGKTASQDCVSFDVPPYTEQWNDVKCKSDTFCVPCQVLETYELRLRGVCEEDLQATYFYFDQLENQHKYLISGYTRYEISLSSDNQTWQLFDMWKDKMVGTWFSHDASYPLGLKEWTLTSNYDICGKPANTKLPLSLSSCYENEYTCGEGSCIHIDQRCDLRVDCPDSSDEVNCDKLVIPDGYLNNLPPPGLDPELPLRLNISIVVKGLPEINILEMKLIVDLSIELSWFDQRVSFRSLKPGMDLNSIDVSRVWYPRFEMANADFPSIHVTEQKLSVKQLTDAEPDDNSLPVRDQIFKGSSNALHLKQKINAPFFCDMNLLRFPFDTQRCILQFGLSSAKSGYAVWHNLSINYTGNKYLTEYVVDDMVMYSETNDEDYSQAVVEVVLNRRYSFYITSTYLPTLMLMFISYVSLFCKQENIDLRVMMTITTLLVLYALYQQIADGLPRTSYTKAIDIWCFYAIIYIFSLVIVNVLAELHVKFMAGQKNSQKISDSSLSIAARYKLRGRRGMLYWARWVYIPVFLLFFIPYWLVLVLNIY